MSASLRGALVVACLATPLMAFQRTPGFYKPPGWLVPPNTELLSRYYPDRAVLIGMNGSVLITCTALPTTKVAGCRIASELPGGMGFGAAALRMTPHFQMSPARMGGVAVSSPVTIPIRFVVDDEARERVAFKWLCVLAAGLAGAWRLRRLSRRRRGRWGWRWLPEPALQAAAASPAIQR